MIGRVLIVDDMVNWCELLADSLSRNGFHVDSANSAIDASQHVDKNSYDVIVLDIRLDAYNPDNADGMSILKSLYESGVLVNTKVIMLSAYGTIEMMKRAFRDYGVADFISKEDFDSHNFVVSVNELISKRE